MPVVPSKSIGTPENGERSDEKISACHEPAEIPASQLLLAKILFSLILRVSSIPSCERLAAISLFLAKEAFKMPLVARVNGPTTAEVITDRAIIVSIKVKPALGTTVLKIYNASLIKYY